MRVGATNAVGIAMLATGLSVAALAQQAPPPPQKPPPLRSRVTVVPIDVRVVDSRGKPVTDLRREDFTVLEDGVRQPIGVFSTQAYVADETASISALPLRGHAEADTAPRNRRVFLFVLGRGRHQTASKGGLTINLIVPVKADVRTLKAIVYDYGADLVGSASARVDH
jgi:hypothetical protein